MVGGVESRRVDITIEGGNGMCSRKASAWLTGPPRAASAGKAGPAMVSAEKAGPRTASARKVRAGTLSLSMAAAAAAAVARVAVVAMAVVLMSPPVALAAATAPPASPAPVKLVLFSHYEKVPPMIGLSQAIDEWNKLHPDIRVEHQIVSFDGTWYQKLVALIAAGQTPDILHIPSIYLADLVGQNVLSPVPDSIIENVIEPNYVPGSLAFTRYHGKTWGIPTEFQPRALAYNLGLFEKAALPDRSPRDWDELVTFARKLTKRTADGKIDVAGFGLWTATWAINGFMGAYFALAWSNGADPFGGPDNTQLNLTSTASQEAVEFLAGLNLREKVMSLATTDFIRDKLGMYIAFGPWERGNMLAQQAGAWYKQNARSGLIPPGKTGKPVAPTFGWMFSVSSTTKAAKQAWEFLTWLNTEGINGTTRMGTVLAQQGSIPVTRKDMEGQAVAKEPFMKGFIQALLGGFVRPDPILPQQDATMAVVHKHLMQALRGEKPVGNALADAEQEVKTLWRSKK